MSFEEFIEESIPPYAILSHTWGDEEVTFKDFDAKPRESSAGWAKIRATCKLALEDEIQYAWVDTCCIDKSSSAELTEAINSMFQWYQRSKVCYAYLGDCAQPLTKAQLQDCRWISRGWTLQELIAPQEITFYDREWVFLGGRQVLSDDLCAITGIRKNILDRFPTDDLRWRLDGIPIGERMSWAAWRKTTRVEDTAYCLLGIFDVNMPLLYGEGPKAFLRLQEEIMRHSNDRSLLAWRTATDVARWNNWSDLMERLPERERAHLYARASEPIWGFLAKSPNDFASFTDLELTAEGRGHKDYTLTNKGIHIRTPLISRDVSEGHDRTDADDRMSGGAFDPYRVDDCLMLPLNYYSRHNLLQVGVFIKRAGNDVYVRTRPHEVGHIPVRGVSLLMSDLYLATKITTAVKHSFTTIYWQAIRLPTNNPRELLLMGVQPVHMWNNVSSVFITCGLKEPIGAAVYQVNNIYSSRGHDEQELSQLILCFGLLNGTPWIHLQTDSNSTQPLSVQFLAELFFQGTYLNIAARSRQNHTCTVELVDSAAGTVVSRQMKGRIDVGTLENQSVYDIILDWTDTVKPMTTTSGASGSEDNSTISGNEADVEPVSLTRLSL